VALLVELTIPVIAPLILMREAACNAQTSESVYKGLRGRGSNSSLTSYSKLLSPSELPTIRHLTDGNRAEFFEHNGV